MAQPNFVSIKVRITLLPVRKTQFFGMLLHRFVTIRLIDRMYAMRISTLYWSDVDENFLKYRRSKYKNIKVLWKREKIKGKKDTAIYKFHVTVESHLARHTLQLYRFFFISDPFRFYHTTHLHPYCEIEM